MLRVKLAFGRLSERLVKRLPKYQGTVEGSLSEQTIDLPDLTKIEKRQSGDG